MEQTSGRSFFDRYFAFIRSLKPSDRFLLLVFGLVFIASTAFTLTILSKETTINIATEGGTFVEGVIGTPRFVNPVLAITRADHDMSALVYSGLVRLNPNGDLENDLAESITVSEDGLVYNIVLKQDNTFHDGESLTAEDVAFTINLIQDANLKSPLRGNWNDVVVEVLGEYELNFVLETPYTPFIENLVVGILPKHIWGGLTIEQLPFSQHNTEPIGSGLYQVKSVERNHSGLINSYTLTRFFGNGYEPNIDEVVLMFYQNETDLLAALEAGAFIGTAALSHNALYELENNTAWTHVQTTLPRVFSVFLNQNRSAALRDQSAREALSTAVDRDKLIEDVLFGYGVPTKTPVPANFLAVESEEATSTSTASSTPLRRAEALLIDGGWEENEDGLWEKDIDGVSTILSITLTSANAEVFERTTNFLASTWRSLGVEVYVELYEQADLVQTIIRPRSYEALLFGTDVGRALDFYPFWHSSQREDPGLNVALYTNITTDNLLETARTSLDTATRTEAIRAFEEEILDETPALFLYSPLFTYLVDEGVHTTSMKRIVNASERFSNIDDWYMNNDDVWPFFAN